MRRGRAWSRKTGPGWGVCGPEAVPQGAGCIRVRKSRTEAAGLAVIRGCGLAPTAAKQNQDGEFGNRAYSPRTHDAFSVQRPLHVGGVRRHASRIRRPDSVKQQLGRPMPRTTANPAASVLLFRTRVQPAPWGTASGPQIPHPEPVFLLQALL